MQNKQNVDFCSVEPSLTGGLVELQAAALEATANAVVITDQTGTVIWVNSAFEQLTGYTHAEIVGQSTRVLKSGQNSRAYTKRCGEPFSEEGYGVENSEIGARTAVCTTKK